MSINHRCHDVCVCIFQGKGRDNLRHCRGHKANLPPKQVWQCVLDLLNQMHHIDLDLPIALDTYALSPSRPQACKVAWCQDNRVGVANLPSDVNMSPKIWLDIDNAKRLLPPFAIERDLPRFKVHGGQCCSIAKGVWLKRGRGGSKTRVAAARRRGEWYAPNSSSPLVAPEATITLRNPRAVVKE